MNNDVQPPDPLDPSSISLFFTEKDLGSAVAPLSSSSANGNIAQPSASNADETYKGSGGGEDKSKKPTNYTNYISGRATEVAKRRNLNERIDRLKGKHGIHFNVSQCHGITMNQLAIFLRRLRKLPNIRGMMSSELMLKTFQESQDIKDGKEKLKNQAVASQQASSSQSLHPPVISVSDLFGSDEENRQKDEEDELTEESTEYDDSEDDESTKNLLMKAEKENVESLNQEDMQFYKERMEILSADLRAVTLYKRLCDLQNKAKNCLNELPEEFVFEFSPSTGNFEEDSCTCSRVRALWSRPKRPLIHYDFEGRRMRQSRAITANSACGILEYSAVDDSIHPQLSLPSSIPMERKVHKHLQVISTLPVEVERRRLKIAQMAFKKGSKALKIFHNCEDLPSLVPFTTSATKAPEQEEANKIVSALAPISLTIKKPKLPSKLAKNHKLLYEENDDEDEGFDAQDTDATSSVDYPLVQRVRRSKGNRRKRKPTFNGGTSGVMEVGRRSSLHTATNHDYGSSMFEYEPSFMDIGLTNVQNVECPEIAIPSFRKKDVMDYSLAMPCICCPGREADSEDFERQKSTEWEIIRGGHEKMEFREKQRFRSICLPNRSTRS